MPQSTLLSALTPSKDNLTIHVRVGRIWGAINKKTNTWSDTKIILLDEQENYIMATIPNNRNNIYLPVLKEHGVYDISYFKVVPRTPLYTTGDRDFVIKFFYKTKIAEKLDTGVLPPYNFDLQPFHKVKCLVRQFKCLIDVIGMVLNHGRLEYNSDHGGEEMDVVLMNERKNVVKVTLYGDQAKKFLQLLTSVENNPILVIITGLLATKASDVPSLSSTDATCCYVNINYSSVNALKDYVASSGNDKWWTLNIAMSNQYFPSTRDIIQEIPTRSLLETVIPTGTQMVRCICRAKIVEIIGKNGWYYNSCPTCPRELQPLAGKLYCLTCEEEPPSLTPRYRIQLHVEDQSGFTTITLFDKEAEQLVGVHLHKILAEQGEEKNFMTIPPPINSIIGKFCAFQLEITPYNIIQGCKEYTSTRVIEISDIGSHTNISPASKPAIAYTPAIGPIDVTTTKRRKLD